MPSTDPNQPQPTPESERSRCQAQLDGSSALSRGGARSDGASSGRHRAPSTQEPESDSPRGLIPDVAIDLLPGEPPVRVSHAWMPSAADPPVGDTEIFTGLTPRVAAMLVVTYTRPGDVIIDTTADLAVEGTATAGSRQYHRRAALPDPASGREWRPSGASLVVLRWPTGPTRETSRDAVRQLPADADLEATLIAGRRVATANAHLVVVADPVSPGRYRDRAGELIRALRATGGGRLRHIVLNHGLHDDAADNAPGTSPDVAAAHRHRIVFVLSLRVGHDG